MSIITEKELRFYRKKLQKYLKFWQWNPVAFIYNLGIAKILPYQAEILQSIVDNKRTIVRSGHGSGKTFIMALGAGWWLCTHWLKGEGSSLIIGPGGGRDVLMALSFGQKRIIGVELNPIIVDAVSNDFRGFTGEVYHYPNVEIHADEGRSFLERSKDKYDIIQASLVDTLAATASGAFALAENNLYTVEAFESYIEHLQDDGMLSFTRWYFEDSPTSSIRLSALAIESLEKMGVSQPRNHLLLIQGGDLATLILKKTPFSQEEVNNAHEVSDDLGFRIIYSPDSVENPIFGKLFNKAERANLYRDYPLNIIPPTDDTPFFFQTARFSDLFSDEPEQGFTQTFVTAVVVLANLLVVMTILAGLFLILPLVLLKPLGISQITRYWKSLLYFILIGFGFIAVEIPLIQQFTLFLGHPIYSLAIVIFSILLFSSFGSFFTRRISPANSPKSITKLLSVFTVVLLAYIILLPAFIHAFIGFTTYLKILITVALLAPLGWLMGTLFPLGIKLTSEKDQFLVPWCWSLNGAFSVLGSVASVATSISVGFSHALMLGWAAYVGVLLLSLMPSRKRLSD